MTAATTATTRTTMTTTTTTINNYRHAFIKDLILNGNHNPSSLQVVQQPFLANSRQTVRVMATITSVDELMNQQEELKLLQLLCPPACSGGTGTGDGDGESTTTTMTTATTTAAATSNSTMKSITLDDGTGSISGIWCSQHFLYDNNSNVGGDDDKIDDNDNIDDDSDEVPHPRPHRHRHRHHFSLLQPGTTIDCILKLRQSSSIKRWVVDCVIVVDDDVDQKSQSQVQVDEPLRWMTVSLLHEQQLQDKDNDAPRNIKMDCSCGFPTLRQDTSEEVYRMICVQSKIYNSNNNNDSKKNNSNNNVVRNSKKRKSLTSSTSTLLVAGPATTGKNRRRVSTIGHSINGMNLKNVKKPQDRLDNHQQMQEDQQLDTNATTTIDDDLNKKVQDYNDVDTMDTDCNDSEKKQKKIPPCTPAPQPQPQPQAPTPLPPPVPLVGVSFDDLQLVLQISSSQLQRFIEDLQLQGQIYQNEKGEFLPL